MSIMMYILLSVSKKDTNNVQKFGKWKNKGFIAWIGVPVVVVGGVTQLQKIRILFLFVENSKKKNFSVIPYRKKK